MQGASSVAVGGMADIALASEARGSGHKDSMLTQAHSQETGRERPNSIQNEVSRLLISQHFLPRSGTNRHFRRTLRNKRFSRASGTTEDNARAFVLLAGRRFALSRNEWCERVAPALEIGAPCPPSPMQQGGYRRDR